MRTLTVTEGQNLPDLAIMAGGTLDALYHLVEDNDLDGLTPTLVPGQKLVVRETPEEPLQAYFRDRRIQVATGAGHDQAPPIGPGADFDARDFSPADFAAE